jgi:hypothetical protein
MMLTLPFKCQKFVTMREQKCKDWQNHRKNSQQNRSGEYVIKEMAPTRQVQVPSSYSFTNIITSIWESVIHDLVSKLCVLPADVSATTTMCCPFPFHHVYLKETSFHFSGTILTIKLWSAKATNFGKFKVRIRISVHGVHHYKLICVWREKQHYFDVWWEINGEHIHFTRVKKSSISSPLRPVFFNL